MMFGKTLNFLFRIVGSVLAIIGGACGIVEEHGIYFLGILLLFLNYQK